MTKELNPDLFGGDPSGAPAARMGASGSAPHEAEAEWGAYAMGPTPADLREFRENERDKEIKILKGKLRESEAKLADLEAKVADQMRAASLRTERVNQRLAQLEVSFNQRIEELNEKMAQTMGKVHERRLTETKVEEMVDRHNNLVRNFEARLAQLTRALSEREIQLMNLATVNEEARRELARLKRL